MYQIFCTVLFAVSFVLLVLLVYFFKNRISLYYAMLFCTIVVTNFGYALLSVAQNEEAADVANMTVYLGACFSPFFLLMCVTELCSVELPKMVRVAGVLVEAAILSVIATNRYHHLYYKSVELVQRGSVIFLEKEYGVLHLLYPVSLLGMVLAGILIISVSFFRKKIVSYITCTVLLILTCLLLLIYGLERYFQFPVELLPLGYVIAQIGVLLLLIRISLYDVTAISADYMMQSMEYGVVVCDNAGRLAGVNEAAKLWFPELAELNIDYVVHREDTGFLRQLQRWIREKDEKENCFFEQNGYVIEARHRCLTQRFGKKIHCISLRDDTQEQKYRKLIENYNENLAREVDEKTEQLSQMRQDITLSMASIVENRDNNTGGHIKRTSDVIKVFVNHLLEEGEQAKLTPAIAKKIINAAPLHDFGKIAIPDRILNKPGKFDPEEYELMKMHPEKGAVIVSQILQNVDDAVFREIAVNIAHYHHEKWDGTGYPSGIAGEQIPYEARIMALADVFDALVSRRVYKERFGYDRVFEMIEEACGTQFDPVLCRKFLECRNELILMYDSYSET